jgi:arylsulfatase A-like enzyme
LDVAGGSTAYPVSGIDFYPTILDLVGVPIPGEDVVDGQALRPLFEGQTLNDRPLFWHYPHYGNQGGEPSSIIRLGKWKLIHYWEDGRDELYDLAGDPSEQSDVLSAFPLVGRDLRTALDAWLTKCDALLPDVDKLYDAERARERDERIVREWWPRLEASRKELLSPAYEPNENWWDSEVIVE